MDVAKMIKLILVEQDLNVSILADKLGTSQQNLSAKMKRNNFSTKEMLEIANVLGYDLVIRFTPKNEKKK